MFKLFHLSVPVFSWESRGITGLWWGLNVVIHVKHLAQDLAEATTQVLAAVVTIFTPPPPLEGAPILFKISVCSLLQYNKIRLFM